MQEASLKYLQNLNQELQYLYIFLLRQCNHAVLYSRLIHNVKTTNISYLILRL